MRVTSPATCSASSRVGISTMACTKRSSGRTMRSISGMPKAAVLPDPVRDCTIRSRPARIRGRVSACTFIAAVNPMSASACNTGAPSPSSSKLMLASSGPSGPGGASSTPSSAFREGSMASGGGVCFSFMGSRLPGAPLAFEALADAVDSDADAVQSGRLLAPEAQQFLGVQHGGFFQIAVGAYHLVQDLGGPGRCRSIQMAARAQHLPLVAPVRAFARPALGLHLIVATQQVVGLLQVLLQRFRHVGQFLLAAAQIGHAHGGADRGPAGHRVALAVDGHPDGDQQVARAHEDDPQRQQRHEPAVRAELLTGPVGGGRGGRFGRVRGGRQRSSRAEAPGGAAESPPQDPGIRAGRSPARDGGATAGAPVGRTRASYEAVNPLSTEPAARPPAIESPLPAKPAGTGHRHRWWPPRAAGLPPPARRRTPGSPPCSGRRPPGRSPAPRP